MTSASGLAAVKDTNGSLGALEEEGMNQSALSMSQPNIGMMHGNNTQGLQNEDLPGTNEMFVDECFGHEPPKGHAESMQRRSRG